MKGCEYILRFKITAVYDDSFEVKDKKRSRKTELGVVDLNKRAKKVDSDAEVETFLSGAEYGFSEAGCSTPVSELLPATNAAGDMIEPLGAFDGGVIFRVGKATNNICKGSICSNRILEVTSSGKKEKMQDYVYHKEICGVPSFLVLDGHGKGAENIVYELAGVVMSEFEILMDKGSLSIEEAMSLAFLKGQNFYIAGKKGRDKKNYTDSGVAALLVYIKDGNMITFHCGDCEAQVWDTSGLRYKTIGHRASVAKGKDAPQEKSAPYMGFDLTRCLGSTGTEGKTRRDGEYNSCRLNPGDKVVLTTDGILEVPDYSFTLGLLAPTATVETMYAAARDWLIEDSPRFIDNIGFVVVM